MNKALVVIGTLVVTGGLLYAFRKKVVALEQKAIDYLLDLNQQWHIAQLHKTTQARFSNFIVAVEKMGYKVIVTSSYRSFSKQNQLHVADSKNAKAGLSEHNYGFALDINIRKGKEVWSKSTRKADWEKTGVPALAIKSGLLWGGAYKTYYDPIHYSVPADTRMLRQLAITQQGTNIEKIVGNKVLIA